MYCIINNASLPLVSYINRGRPALKMTAMYSCWFSEAANINSPDCCLRRKLNRIPANREHQAGFSLPPDLYFLDPVTKQKKKPTLVNVQLLQTKGRVFYVHGSLQCYQLRCRHIVPRGIICLLFATQARTRLPSHTHTHTHRVAA